MRFPKVVRYRKAEVTIYGKKKKYLFYRLVYRVDGKRRMRAFRTYSDAITQAKKLVKSLSQGSPVAALSAAQARDAISALERLQGLYVATGRRVSLLAAVSEFSDASVNKLNGRILGDVVESYLKTIASVKRKTVAEAVEEFIETRRPLAEAKAGKRAKLSKNYACLVGLWLREFAKTFPATAVCELGKEHLDLYMRKHDAHAPKSRNHFRGAVKMFLTWCAKRDYLSSTHRLFEADSMVTEAADMSEIEYYRPKELQEMLESASDNLDFKELLPVIALGGLAGLRLEETLRLEWDDVWRVGGACGNKGAKGEDPFTQARGNVSDFGQRQQMIEPGIGCQIKDAFRMIRRGFVHPGSATG